MIQEENKIKQAQKSQKYQTFKANKKQEDRELKDYIKDIMQKQKRNDENVQKYK